jgi:hypothetical protein
MLPLQQKEIHQIKTFLMTPTTLYYECPVSKENLPEKNDLVLTDLGWITYFVSEHAPGFHFMIDDKHVEPKSIFRPLDLSHPPELSNEKVEAFVEEIDARQGDYYESGQKTGRWEGLIHAASIYAPHFTAMQKAMSELAEQLDQHTVLADKQGERIKELEGVLVVAEATIRTPLSRRIGQAGKALELSRAALTSKP